MAKRTNKHNKHKNNSIDATEDCYYYLYSTCKRGEHCKYRHNALSKQSTILCQEWYDSKINNGTNNCREECPLRHSTYHMQKQREEVECYWENTETGCQKEFCEFKHNDPEKDLWKRGIIKNLSEIKKDKNINSNSNKGSMTPEEFESHRREVIARKRHLYKVKKAKKHMSSNFQSIMETMDEEQRKEFQRVLGLVNNSKGNTNSADNSNLKNIADNNSDDLDAELEELNDIC